MLNRFEQFTHLISKIQKDINRIKLQELKKFGLKGSQLDFIYYLGKNKELTFKEFCTVLNCNKAFVSRNIAMLKTQGLIKENTNSDNKITFSLNDRGLEIYRLNKDKTEEICNIVYLNDDDIEAFYNNLNAIADKLHKIGEDL